MSLKTEAKFTSRRTYVIKLHSHAHRGAMTGRIENFLTGRQHEFASGDELVASLLNDLEANDAAPDTPRDER